MRILREGREFVQTFAQKSNEFYLRQQARDQLEKSCSELSAILKNCEEKAECKEQCEKDHKYLMEVERLLHDCTVHSVKEYEKELKTVQGRVAAYGSSLARTVQRKRKNHCVYCGIWRDGRMTGLFDCYSESNVKLFKSEYRDGYKNGECTTYYPSGAVYAVMHYEQDVLLGPFVGYHENGQYSEICKYENGAREGYHAVFWENGQIAKEEMVEKGKHVYALAFHPNGNIKEYHLFTKKGYLKSSVQFTPAGELYYWGAFKNGKFDGRSLLFFHTQFFACVTFEEGKLVVDGEVVPAKEYSMRELEKQFAASGTLKRDRIHWHPIITNTCLMPQRKQVVASYHGTNHVLHSVDFETDFDKVRESSGDAVRWVEEGNVVELSERDVQRRSLYMSSIENGVVKDFTLFGDMVEMREVSYVPVKKVLCTTYYPSGRSEVLLNDPDKCRKKSEGEIVDKKRAGHWVKYYNNGMKMMEGDIVDGKWENVVKYFNSGKRMAASDSCCIVCFTMVGVVLCTRHLLEPQRNAADFRSEVGWTQAGRDSPNLHGARHL